MQNITANNYEAIVAGLAEAHNRAAAGIAHDYHAPVIERVKAAFKLYFADNPTASLPVDKGSQLLRDAHTISDKLTAGIRRPDSMKFQDGAAYLADVIAGKRTSPSADLAAREGLLGQLTREMGPNADARRLAIASRLRERDWSPKFTKLPSAEREAFMGMEARAGVLDTNPFAALTDAQKKDRIRTLVSGHTIDECREALVGGVQRLGDQAGLAAIKEPKIRMAMPVPKASYQGPEGLVRVFGYSDGTLVMMQETRGGKAHKAVLLEKGLSWEKCLSHANGNKKAIFGLPAVGGLLTLHEPIPVKPATTRGKKTPAITPPADAPHVETHAPAGEVVHTPTGDHPHPTGVPQLNEHELARLNQRPQQERVIAQLIDEGAHLPSGEPHLTPPPLGEHPHPTGVPQMSERQLAALNHATPQDRQIAQLLADQGGHPIPPTVTAPVPPVEVPRSPLMLPAHLPTPAETGLSGTPPFVPPPLPDAHDVARLNHRSGQERVIAGMLDEAGHKPPIQGGVPRPQGHVPTNNLQQGAHALEQVAHTPAPKITKLAVASMAIGAALLTLMGVGFSRATRARAHNQKQDTMAVAPGADVQLGAIAVKPVEQTRDSGWVAEQAMRKETQTAEVRR